MKKERKYTLTVTERQLDIIYKSIRDSYSLAVGRSVDALWSLVYVKKAYTKKDCYEICRALSMLEMLTNKAYLNTKSKEYEDYVGKLLEISTCIVNTFNSGPLPVIEKAREE